MFINIQIYKVINNKYLTCVCNFVYACIPYWLSNSSTHYSQQPNTFNKTQGKPDQTKPQMIIQNTKPNIQSPKIADNPHTYSSKAIGIKPPNHFVYCPPQMRLLSRLLDRLSVLGILLTGLIHNQTHTYYHMIYIYPQAI